MTLNDFPKIELESKYKNLHDNIENYGESKIKEIYPYENVGTDIEGMDTWTGISKDNICERVNNIDNSCSGYYTYVSKVVAKTKIVYKVLYPDLSNLIKSVKNYENTRNQAISINSQLQAAINEESNNE